MNTNNIFLSHTRSTPSLREASKNTREQRTETTRPSTPDGTKQASHGRPFWYDRMIEGGLILSLLCYYLTGNANLHLGAISHLDPLYSLPFLLIFALLCWHRFAVALAVLPLTLPFYSDGNQNTYQKVIINIFTSQHHPISLSMAEATMLVFLAVAALRFLCKDTDRQLWRSLPARIGPFFWPILLFFLLALLSIHTAVSTKAALYAFHEEVLAPLLYLVLLLVYLRTRLDIQRLLEAMLATGLLVTIFGLVQYFLLKLPPDAEGDRIHAMYGSGNSVGTLFDYILPIALALLLSRVHWRYRILTLIVTLPMILVLYLSDSRGAWFAFGFALLFCIGCAIRNRRVVLISSLVFVLLIGMLTAVFHTTILGTLENGHVSKSGASTLLKRPYLWLTAWHMIEDHPWLGVGLDNWLCYYSLNGLCKAPVFHYAVTHKLDHPKELNGLQDEPELSHPHNILLHVWVSIGVFGLLAFIAVLVCFYWLFGRILAQLRSQGGDESERLRWMEVGLGAAMVAMLAQGMVDSTFLEQDLAFCFWILIASLLVIRTISGTPWRNSASATVIDGEVLATRNSSIQ